MSRNPKDTRRRLLEQAQKQFCEAGYHGTDSNRIAREAGFSPQTFYRHFSDKRAIFLEVYEAFSRAVLARVATATSARQLARGIIALHREWGAFRPSLISLFATDDVVRQARLLKQQDQLTEVGKMLNIEPSEALFFIWACERMADGIALGEARALRITERALTDQFVRLFGTCFDERA